MGLRFGAKAYSCLLAILISVVAVPARAAALDLSAYKGKVVYLDFWASAIFFCWEKSSFRITSNSPSNPMPAGMDSNWYNISA